MSDSVIGDLEAINSAPPYDASGAELHLAVPPQRFAELQRLLADISRGRIELQPISRIIAGKPAPKGAA